MAGRGKEFIVGIFSLIGLIALIALTIKIKGPLFEGKYRVYVRFQEVAGTLERGASVLVYGVRVGEVVDIAIDPDAAHPDHPVLLELQIQNSLTLYENANVIIQESAIIGATKVVVTPGTPTAPKVGEDQVIIGSPNADILATITEQGPEIFYEVAQSVNIVNAFLSDLQENQKVHTAINDLAEIISYLRESLTTGEGDIRASLRAVRDFSEDLNESLQLFNEVLVTTRTEIQALRAEVTDAVDTLHIYSHDRLAQAGEILDHIDSSVAVIDTYLTESAPQWQTMTSDLASSTGHLELILGRLESAEGTAGRLIADDAIHRELLAAIQALNRWITSIEAWLAGIEGRVEERLIEYDRTVRDIPPEARRP